LPIRILLHGAVHADQRPYPTRRSSDLTMADPALVELVISAGSDDAARARALRLLGFAADSPVRVVAVRSSLPLDQLGSLICPSRDRKSTRLNSSHVKISYAVFCLQKKK